ncbi:uncharacterized protein METZ01_LOCUS486007 [marine metagenome]|uniref:DUF4177 domain-containing protein n=1 Tax=marine metagenome TaxID=408172 RepID=A0A383CM82_9ZZZZ
MSSKKINQSVRNALILSSLLVVALLTMGATFGTSTWEYKCVDTNRDDARYMFISYLEEKFNALGNQGWEMVGVAMNNGANVRYVCFKREK